MNVAQEMRKDVISKTAQADKQGEVVAAKLSIEIGQSRADARKKSAEGDKASNMILAEGESYKLQRMAEGEAVKIKCIAEAEAAKTQMTAKADASKIRFLGEAEASRIRNVGESEAYSQKAIGEAKADAYKAQVEAMGGDNLARLKIVEAIAEGQIKVVPDILVSSNGANGNLSDILTLFVTQKVVKEAKTTEDVDIKKVMPEDAKKVEEEETF